MPASDRLLLASIHDVSPRFETEVEALVEMLAPYVGTRLAMLVVPNHWGDAPIIPGSAFATQLRAWSDNGAEMFLHGYFHHDDALHAGMADRARARLMTAGEGEFLGLSRGTAAARIAKGRALLENVIGRPIAGFIAPAWLYGPGARYALARAGIALAEDHLRVWSPASGEVLARGPVISWTSRTPIRLASSLLAAAALRHAPIDVLRIGVHPPDVHHPTIVRSIEKTFASGTRARRAGRYSELRPPQR